MQVAQSVSKYEKKLVEGLATMLTHLPAVKVKDTNIAESELWSTYYHPLFTYLFSDPANNVLLRWTNKAPDDYRKYRPDAIISQFQNNVEKTIGYGECKLFNANSSAMCKDLIKLTKFTQRSLNINGRNHVFSFQIR
ncbi:hypothetical protein CU097_002755, partial [Rhizopus azygosporus]